MSSYHCVGVLSDLLLDCLHLVIEVLTEYVIQISVNNDTILHSTARCCKVIPFHMVIQVLV